MSISLVYYLGSNKKTNNNELKNYRQFMEDEDALREKLTELRHEHQGLDEAISRLVEMPVVDALQLQRLKKRKLQLKDIIEKIENDLIPDIIA